MSSGQDKELARCEKFRDEAFSSNPAVQFMFKHLKRGGCELSADKVECKRCEGQLAGGFQDDGGILLCSNHLTTQAHTSNTLVHEAVHAFDACRAKVDWGNCVHHACSEIRAAALSGDCNFTREVLLRRNFGFAKQFQRCVKRRAELSVSLNPYCDQLAVRNSTQFYHGYVLHWKLRGTKVTGCISWRTPIELLSILLLQYPSSDKVLTILYVQHALFAQTKLAVQEAWDSCFNDTAPFDKLP